MFEVKPSENDRLEETEAKFLAVLEVDFLGLQLGVLGLVSIKIHSIPDKLYNFVPSVAFIRVVYSMFSFGMVAIAALVLGDRVLFWVLCRAD